MPAFAGMTAPGFTLIEILLALFIFAIVAVITGSVLHSVLRARQQSEIHLEQLTQLQLAVALIRGDVTEMISRPITDETGKELPALFSMPHYFEFTRIGPQDPLQLKAPLQRIAYYLQADRLIRKTWPKLDRSQDTQFSEKIILTNINSFDISYLSYGQGFSENWPPPKSSTMDSIDINTSVPRAVLVIIGFKNSDSLRLILPIAATTLANVKT